MSSTGPSLSEKVAYCSAVCLETSEVDSMEVEGNCTAETSAAFLRQLRATPDLRLRLVALPGYSPDFNADEAVWD